MYFIFLFKMKPPYEKNEIITFIDPNIIMIPTIIRNIPQTVFTIL